MKKFLQHYKINIGKQIKKFRLLNKLSIKDVQRLLYQYNYPVSNKIIYKWENNTVTPNLSCLLMLCDIFNVTTTTFFRSENSKRTSMTKQEIDFILTLRNNKSYKKIINNLYKKEVVTNVKTRTKTEDSPKD